jgi:lipoate-protein ligase B
MDLQTSLSEQVADGRHHPCLLLLEHPHTYTFGARGEPDHLLWSSEQVAQGGASVHWTDRGGDVTYHGPGQLVGYPILPLGRIQADGRLPKVDYLSYLRRLEEVIIRTLIHYRIAAQRIPGRTGVWVRPEATPGSPAPPPAKIASIGVKVTAQGVSQHGFALNVDPDMRYWEGIIACGIPDAHSISLSDLMGSPPEMREVIEICVREFGHVFRHSMSSEPSNLPQDLRSNPSA